ncbi:MAG: bifunctional folylpolyglutamate synthase/dihydrofolate synthase [Candidatus Omnitrophica bacterium]|nr:bifunctional folylpolyglutamate synthase/dihydrofolate synthase [Candidatus Omnitrophota bacterium]
MLFSLQSYLDSFLDWEAHLQKAGPEAFSLNDFEKLIVLFGRPDDKLKFAHIAGSKGKGSTAIFLASILRSAGYRVGLYTSPHLYSVRERIRILSPGGTPSSFEGMISEEEFFDRVKYYSAPVDEFRKSGGRVTYYEFLTAIAVSYFAANNVEVVVLETGLGGRLDATNVFETSVCGITSIGLEHTQILGDTLSKIAAEKAGIVKSPLQKVVLAPQEPEAMAVLEARAREFYLSPTVVGKDLPFQIVSQDEAGTCFEAQGRRNYQNLYIKLLGRHQVVNAATALAMAEDLEMYGLLLTEEAVQKGLVEALWPARFEMVHKKPYVVLDCAHTLESARALAQTFKAVFPGRKATLVFGASQDKNIPAILKELGAVSDRVILTKANHARACDFSKFNAHEVLGQAPVPKVATVPAAMTQALDSARDTDIILVAGSVFVAAEAREFLNVPV